jgi:hypothetical protein
MKSQIKIGKSSQQILLDHYPNQKDQKMKQAHFVKTNIELSLEGQAKIFRDEVFKHHGLPRKVISDRGPQYVSKFMTDLYSLLGIKGNPSTAFHPQTDG